MEQDQKTYALVAAAKQGDGNAFTELYNSAYQMVYHTCFGYLKNREDAEDTTQEVLIYIYNKLSELEDNYAFYGWAKIIAVHTSLNKIKAKRDNISYDDAIGSEEVLEGDDNLEMLPDTYVLRDEKRKIVMGIMEKELSEVQYQTLFMYYYNDLKIEQIAQIMEVSEGTVKTRLKSAKIKVKQGITDYENKTGDRLAINGAIPSIAMILKASTNSVPVSVMPFAGMGAFGAAGSLAASGIAKAANLILNAGGKAAAGISKGVGGASAGGQIPSVQPRVPSTPPQAPISHPQAPEQMPTNPQVPSVNPPAPGVQAPVSNPVVNPARDAAKKTASGAAKKTAGKGIVTKVVAGVVAIGVIGGGTIGVMKLIEKNKNKDESKKESSETTIPVAADVDPLANPDFEVGGKVTFGNYGGEDISWLVLDEQDGKYLVISENVIDYRQFFAEPLYDVSWENSTLREWLNDDFYNEALPSNVRDRIVLSNVESCEYEGYSQDRVFVLSRNEVEKYFDSKEGRCGIPTDYAIERGCPLTGDNTTSWYLRNNLITCDGGPGGFGAFAVHNNQVNTIIEDPNQDITSIEEPILVDLTGIYCGVRPAFWIASDDYKNTESVMDETETNTIPEDVEFTYDLSDYLQIVDSEIYLSCGDGNAVIGPVPQFTLADAEAQNTINDALKKYVRSISVTPVNDRVITVEIRSISHPYAGGVWVEYYVIDLKEGRFLTDQEIIDLTAYSGQSPDAITSAKVEYFESVVTNAGGQKFFVGGDGRLFMDMYASGDDPGAISVDTKSSYVVANENTWFANYEFTNNGDLVTGISSFEHDPL
ncbi:MAG: sigma-70 family RNA polymerase sigma factor [Saccharofermentans sp.]|nr:sigma-70 family RNA polymerase sigma factor [Saccharofermentans sp.]